MALSGLSPKPGSQKTLEADRKGSQKDSQGIEPPTRDPKKILVGACDQNPWSSEALARQRHIMLLHSEFKGCSPPRPCIQAAWGCSTGTQGTSRALHTAPSCRRLPFQTARASPHTHIMKATQGLRRELQGEGSAHQGLC